MHALVRKFALDKLRQMGENTPSLHYRMMSHLAVQGTRHQLTSICEHLQQLYLEHGVAAAATLFFPYFFLGALHEGERTDILACRRLASAPCCAPSPCRGYVR
jgi:hypothetical protein